QPGGPFRAAGRGRPAAARARGDALPRAGAMTPGTAAGVPWYRVGMVWLLLAFPLASVVGGCVMLALALGSDDGLVADDDYRRGMEINRELARDRAAAARGAQALVRLGPERHEAVLRLRLAQGQRPPRLELRFLHATRAGFDRV